MMLEVSLATTSGVPVFNLDGFGTDEKQEREVPQRILDATELDIMEDIDEWWGIGAQEFSRQLRELGDVDEIQVNINSDGGDYIDGMAIFSMLERHSAKIITQVDGLAASIASVIFMAGDERRIAENAWLMIHNPWAAKFFFVSGESDDLRKRAVAIGADLEKLAVLLERFKPGIINAYQRGSDLEDTELSKLMDEESWLDSSQALDMGLATEVTGRIDIAARVRDVPAELRDQWSEFPINAEASEPAAPAAPLDMLMRRQKLAELRSV